MLKDALLESPVWFIQIQTNHTLYLKTLQNTHAVFTQEHTCTIDSKTLKHQHAITYVSVLFQSSQHNWTTLTKEAYATYMAVMKLSFYLKDAVITLQNDHLLLK